MKFIEHLIQEGFAKRTYRKRGEGVFSPSELQTLTSLLAKGMAAEAAGAIESSRRTPGYNFVWDDLLQDEELWEEYLRYVTDEIYDAIRSEYQKIMSGKQK